MSVACISCLCCRRSSLEVTDRAEGGEANSSNGSLI